MIHVANKDGRERSFKWFLAADGYFGGHSLVRAGFLRTWRGSRMGHERGDIRGHNDLANE